MAYFKTFLAISCSINYFSGKSYHTKYNYLFINKYKRNKKDNKHPGDKGEKEVIIKSY